MITNNLKKNVFINLLSLSGYIYFGLIIWVNNFIRPDVMNIEGYPHTDTEIVGMVNASSYINIVFFVLIAFFIITLILIILALIEALLKKNKKIPEIKISNNTIYTFLFWFGLVLQLSPLAFIFLTFFTKA